MQAAILAGRNGEYKEILCRSRGEYCLAHSHICIARCAPFRTVIYCSGACAVARAIHQYD
jgi:hypothetical protein